MASRSSPSCLLSDDGGEGGSHLAKVAARDSRFIPRPRPLFRPARLSRSRAPPPGSKNAGSKLSAQHRPKIRPAFIRAPVSTTPKKGYQRKCQDQDPSSLARQTLPTPTSTRQNNTATEILRKALTLPNTLVGTNFPTERPDLSRFAHTFGHARISRITRHF